MKKLLLTLSLICLLILTTSCNSKFESARELSIKGYSLDVYSYEYSLYLNEMPIETYRFYHQGYNSRLEVYDESQSLSKIYIYRGQEDIKYEKSIKEDKVIITTKVSSNPFFKDYDKKLDPLYYEKLGLEITGNLKHREEDVYEDEKLFTWPKLKEVVNSNHENIESLLLIQEDSFSNDKFVKKTWLDKKTGLLLKTETFLNSNLISITNCTNINYTDIDDSLFIIPKSN